MSANLSDKITDVRNAARPNSARVTSGRSAGGATLACDNLSGWPTASKVHFVTYKIDSNSAVVAGSQLDCYGIVSGNNIGSFTVADGTDTGHAVGDVVEMLPTAAWGQDLADALTAQHSRAGAHVGINNTSGLTTDTLVVTSGSTLPAGDIVNADLGADSVTAAKLADDSVFPANLNSANSSSGSSWAWQSWTPTWANLTVGNATQASKYMQVGKTIYFRVSIVLGNTSSVASNPTFTLPITSISYPGTSGTQHIGFTSIYDQSSTNLYNGPCDWLTTTTAKPQTYAVSGSNVITSGLSSTVPITFTTSDEIYVMGTYEAA